MKNIVLIIILITTARTGFSQTTAKHGTKKEKIFLSAGYGLAGSFFVKSYGESTPIPGNQIFYKKNFIGAAQNISIGINIKNNYQIRFGFHFQHFTRHINARDTLRNSVLIFLDHTIHHRDYIWYAGINKNYKKNKHLFSPGLGLYFLRPKQEEVEIYPGGFVNIERGGKKYDLDEGGVYAEFAYEYMFQPKVNLGFKTQFYYTASASYFESIVFYPYIKISF
jgi:hypothetical protein